MGHVGGLRPCTTTRQVDRDAPVERTRYRVKWESQPEQAEREEVTKEVKEKEKEGIEKEKGKEKEKEKEKENENEKTTTTAAEEKMETS